MIIIEDTRQQNKKHERKHRDWKKAGDEIIRSKLVVGDYTLPPKISIDTKKDIHEIGANICGSVDDNKRFSEECKLAKRIGCKLIILIEDKRFSSIDDLYGKAIELHSGRIIPGDQLAVAMRTLSGRYGVDFMFCKPGDTAEVVKKLLNNGK